MQTTFALAALAAVAYAAPSPQGVTADIPAPGYPPAGAATSYPGPFEVTIVSAASTKRDLVEVCHYNSSVLFFPVLTDLSVKQSIADNPDTLPLLLPTVFSLMLRAGQDTSLPTSNSNSTRPLKLVLSTPEDSLSFPTPLWLLVAPLSSGNAQAGVFPISTIRIGLLNAMLFSSTFFLAAPLVSLVKQLMDNLKPLQLSLPQ
jgi:hypothetical protein